MDAKVFTAKTLKFSDQKDVEQSIVKLDKELSAEKRLSSLLAKTQIVQPSRGEKNNWLIWQLRMLKVNYN